MTAKETAEKYVREQIPDLLELSFGCEVEFVKNLSTEYREYYEGDKVLVGSDSWVESRLLSWEDRKTAWKIIGHPIQLQHWLRVLNNMLYIVDGFGNLYLLEMRGDWKVPKITSDAILQFDLTTGQPASEADYQAFNQIVGLTTEV